MTDRLRHADGWLGAGLAAGVTLVAVFAGSVLLPGLASPVAKVALPVAAAAAWLYRHELRSGGWWTVAGIVALGIGLALFLVSPSFLARLVP